jgi:hypothetical protein
MNQQAEDAEAIRRTDASIQQSLARADKLLADADKWRASAPQGMLADPKIRDLVNSINEREANIGRVREELQNALTPYDLETKKQALDEALRLLDNKLRAIDIVGTTAIDFDVPKYLGSKGYRAQSREMLSAVETTAQAAGSHVVKPTVFNSAAIPEHLRHTEEIFGAGLGTRRAVAARALADHIHSERDWFIEAANSLVWNEQEKKFSSSLLFCDFGEAWRKVYQGESGHTCAKEAAEHHIEEMVKAGKNYTDRFRDAGREMNGAILTAVARFKAVVDDQSENEQKRRAAVMIAATEVNMELTALSFVELSQQPAQSLLVAKARLGLLEKLQFGGEHDLAHGFGPNSLFTDEASEYLRNKTELADQRKDAWVHAIWRMALEGCAFPNVSDTFTAMAQASKEAQSKMLSPPDGSPSNAEVRLMQVAYWARMVTAAADNESRELVDNGRLLDHYTWLARAGEVPVPPMIFDAVERVAPVAKDSTWSADPDKYELRRVEFRGILRQWSCGWREQGYARLDVSHKLAAALMLTDMVESIAVRAPWKCFSVHVPPGITRVSRILCMGEETKIAPVAVIFEDGSFGEFNDNHLTDLEVELLRNFVRGACMAVEQGHAQRAGNHGTSGAKGASKRSKPGGPEAGERYQLAAPVKIDLRDVVREHLSGKHKGGSPKVQFIVRGHPRNQACGPKLQSRKLIWVPPFWKGDPDAVALLRGYEVEGDKLKGKS